MAKAVQPALFGEGELQAAPSPLVVEAQRVWNEFSAKNNWRKCGGLDKARRATILRAIADYGGMQAWKKALETVERSRFVMGKVPPRPGSGFKQFKASIDWFCQAKTIRQYHDDFYEDDGGQDGTTSASFSDKLRAASFDWRARLDRYKKAGFWHKDTEGNRPEDPGPHKAPAEMIDAWRSRHGITQKPAPGSETREERLASTIVSYRRIGRWDRANELELELAGIEKRPPTLVPAPDASQIGMPPRPDFRPQRTSNMGHNRPPGPITDVLDEDPGWTDIPEGAEHEHAD